MAEKQKDGYMNNGGAANAMKFFNDAYEARYGAMVGNKDQISDGVAYQQGGSAPKKTRDQAMKERASSKSMDLTKAQKKTNASVKKGGKKNIKATF